MASGPCEKITKSCHSEPFAVILSEAKDLALGAQGKLREESAFVCFQEDKSRFFASLRMTDDFFTASRYVFWPGSVERPVARRSGLEFDRVLLPADEHTRI